jgi:hypothetical protein
MWAEGERIDLEAKFADYQPPPPPPPPGPGIVRNVAEWSFKVGGGPVFSDQGVGVGPVVRLEYDGFSLFGASANVDAAAAWSEASGPVGFSSLGVKF